MRRVGCEHLSFFSEKAFQITQEEAIVVLVMAQVGFVFGVPITDLLGYKTVEEHEEDIKAFGAKITKNVAKVD